MYQSTIEFVRKWNAAKTERQKLQDVYLVVGVAIVILSGLVTFINSDLGYTMVMVGLVILAAFVVNVVSWHLLSSIFLSKLGSRTKKK